MLARCGRVALIAARRQRNPRAILLAHGAGGEKSDRFSRRGEQDRRLVRPYQQISILQLFLRNSYNENALQKILLLEKTVFSVRQKGVLPLLLPASMLQLPRCLVRIYNLDAHDTTLSEFESFKTCNCSRKNRLQNTICFANVGCSPTPRQHF